MNYRMMHHPNSGIQEAGSCVRTCSCAASRAQSHFAKDRAYSALHSCDLPFYIRATIGFILKILKY